MEIGNDLTRPLRDYLPDLKSSTLDSDDDLDLRISQRSEAQSRPYFALQSSSEFRVIESPEFGMDDHLSSTDISLNDMTVLSMKTLKQVTRNLKVVSSDSDNIKGNSSLSFSVASDDGKPVDSTQQEFFVPKVERIQDRLNGVFNDPSSSGRQDVPASSTRFPSHFPVSNEEGVPDVSWSKQFSPDNFTRTDKSETVLFSNENSPREAGYCFPGFFASSEPSRLDQFSVLPSDVYSSALGSIGSTEDSVLPNDYLKVVSMRSRHASFDGASGLFSRVNPPYPPIGQHSHVSSVWRPAGGRERTLSNDFNTSFSGQNDSLPKEFGTSTRTPPRYYPTSFSEGVIDEEFSTSSPIRSSTRPTNSTASICPSPITPSVSTLKSARSKISVDEHRPTTPTSHLSRFISNPSPISSNHHRLSRRDRSGSLLSITSSYNGASSPPMRTRARTTSSVAPQSPVSPSPSLVVVVNGNNSSNLGLKSDRGAIAESSPLPDRSDAESPVIFLGGISIRGRKGIMTVIPSPTCACVDKLNHHISCSHLTSNPMSSTLSSSSGVAFGTPGVRLTPITTQFDSLKLSPSGESSLSLNDDDISSPPALLSRGVSNSSANGSVGRKRKGEANDVVGAPGSSPYSVGRGLPRPHPRRIT